MWRGHYKLPSGNMNTQNVNNRASVTVVLHCCVEYVSKYLYSQQDAAHFAGMKRQNFVRTILDGIISQQNDNKVLSIKYVLIRGESADNAAIMNTLLLDDFKRLRNNFLEKDNMWLLSEITQT